MRWPFRRAGSDAGADQPAPAPPSAPAAPVGEWRKLPALQRVSAELAPVAPLDRFADSLPTHQDPRFLAPLAHALTPDAPNGEVTGLAEPVTAAPPSVREFGPLPRHGDVPVQRHQAEPTPVPVQRAVPVTPAPAGPGGLPVVEPRPVPALPDVVVARAADPAPAEQPSADPSAPLVSGGEGTSLLTGAGNTTSGPDAPIVSRSAGPGSPAPAPGGNGPAGELPAPGAPATMPVVSRTVQTEPAGTPRAVSLSLAPNLPALPPVLPAGGFPIPSSEPSGESDRESVGVAGSVADGGSGGESEVPVAASAADVVQRTTGGSGPGSPAVPVRPESSAVSMPPLPVVSRSIANTPTGPSNSSIGWSGAPAVPAGSSGTSPDTGSQPTGEPSGPSAEAPLIGSAGLSPLVAALGGTDESPGVPGSPVAGGKDLPVVARSTADPDGSDVPTVARTGAPGDVGMPVIGRTAGGPGSVPTLGRSSDELGMPVVARTADDSGSVPTLGRTPDELGTPVVARTAGDSGSVPTLGRSADELGMPVVARSAGGHPQPVVAGGNQAGPVVQRTADRVPLPVAPARLMWPPAPAAPQPQAPLTSERPLTVPHDPGEYAELPPPVQRVSFEPPATPPTGPQPTPVAPLRSAPAPSETVAPVHDLPVMRSEDPAPSRDVAVAMPLQRMFGDAPATAEPVQEVRWQAPVQRDEIATSPAGGPAAESTPAPAPAPAAPGSAVQAAGPAAKAPSASDLDEMAKRLYEPLTARLRAELWLDRERAGLVTDRRY